LAGMLAGWRAAVKQTQSVVCLAIATHACLADMQPTVLGSDWWSGLIPGTTSNHGSVDQLRDVDVRAADGLNDSGSLTDPAGPDTVPGKPPPPHLG